MPADVRLYGRNILTLNSLGLGDFACAKLLGLPAEFHHAPWFWEAARFLCFTEPAISSSNRDALLVNALSLKDDDVTAEFRAYCRYYTAGDWSGSLQILERIPRDKLMIYSAELMLKIYLEQKKLPEALALARRTDCFDLRSGHHWEYLAQAEELTGNPDAARAAWRKAVFYYPDDLDLMNAARIFAAKYNDTALAQAIADSGKVYGVPAR